MHDLLVEKTIAAYKHLAGHHDQDTYAGRVGTTQTKRLSRSPLGGRRSRKPLDL